MQGSVLFMKDSGAGGGGVPENIDIGKAFLSQLFAKPFALVEMVLEMEQMLAGAESVRQEIGTGTMAAAG